MKRLLLDHRQERSPPRRSGLGLPATMPIISTPCPAARRGVGRTASSTRTSTRSGTTPPSTPPCRPSAWGEGYCGVGGTGSHFAPTLVRVCVRCRPPPCQPLPPDATRELPAARCQRRAAWFSPLRSRSLSSGCAATAPCRCPVLFDATRDFRPTISGHRRDERTQPGPVALGGNLDT